MSYKAYDNHCRFLIELECAPINDKYVEAHADPKSGEVVMCELDAAAQKRIDAFIVRFVF